MPAKPEKKSSSSLVFSSGTKRLKKRRRLLSADSAGGSTKASEADASSSKVADDGEEFDEAILAQEEDVSSDDNGLVDDGSSDDSEDDAPRNRIGNVPLEWYKDEEHVGYDVAGERIMRTISTSEIDALLESKDNPDAWRTIKDQKNQREIVLTDTDLEIIRRIRARMYPSAATDTLEMVEFENPEAKIHPVTKAHPPKRRFLPSKWEGMKIKRLVALLREGKIRPPPPPAPEVWDLWSDEVERRKHAPPPLPAPKMALPGHGESYNPPSEYLFTEEEKKEWEEQDEYDRKISVIPQKHDSLRRVPGYKEFITDRFKRCLDLYLVPRALKQRMNVDPECLLPKLPSPKDLRPFPTHIAVAYEGHTGMVRIVAVESNGRYIATGSSDETLRIWEVSTGRPLRVLTFASAVTAVAWHPKRLLLAVAAEEAVFFLDPGLEIPEVAKAEHAAAQEADPTEEPFVTVASLLEFKEVKAKPTMADDPEENEEKSEGAKARAVRWRVVEPESQHFKLGCRLSIATDGDVRQLTWHAKGNYCAAVSPKAKAASNQCLIHALNQQKSMRPFAKIKGGLVQSCAFHPTKPHFLVATMRNVRIYDLLAQRQLKLLISGAKWISSVSVHPSGDHVVVGSYDRRIVWWDLDFASKPYKTLQYHDRAVRCATFHPGKFPLLAACADDATVSILHAKVFSDLMQSPMIVPVKRLRDHMINQGLGVLSCAWHPLQPWLFTAGADGRVFLWA